MTEATLERLVDTYLSYAYPGGIFVFQGGEPTLAGAGYFEALCRFQTQYGRAGQVISNSIQTNGMLIDERWCALFREYDWLVGLSLESMVNHRTGCGANALFGTARLGKCWFGVRIKAQKLGPLFGIFPAPAMRKPHSS